MHSTRFTQLLLTALGLVSVAQAAGIRYNARGIMVRQDDDGDDSIIPTVLPGIPGGGDDDDDGGDDVTETTPAGSSPSSPPAPTTSSADPLPDPTTSTTEEDIPTSTPADDPSTSDAPTSDPTTSDSGNDTPTTTTPDADPPASTTSQPQDEPSSTSSREDNNSSDDGSSTTRTPVVSTAIETVTRTNSDGSLTTQTSSTVTTSTPDTQSGEGSGSGGGLDPNTRNIVIGVVVGVGGAILLGALGVVAWRIRNRKKAAEENDGLMGDMDYAADGSYSGAGYSQMEGKSAQGETLPGSAGGTNTMTSTGTAGGQGRSPFTTNLESYHQPTQPVNASSNF